jgi:hypothetical protein
MAGMAKAKLRRRRSGQGTNGERDRRVGQDSAALDRLRRESDGLAVGSRSAGCAGAQAPGGMREQMIKDIQELERLAKAVRPINDDDWGSERQIAAENAFFDAVGMDENGECRLGDDFNCYCLQATVDERIDEALRLLRLEKANT